MSRSMLKLIHADKFFKDEEVAALKNAATSLNYVEKEYGHEVENFNLIPPNANELFTYALGEPSIVDENRSGIFRRPINCVIHFEGFENIDEWCFVIALERTTFNIYKHLSGAESALDGYKFNYRNLFEWDYQVNIQLQPNQGVFFRPWLFHSIEDGIVQYYRILPESKKKVEEHGD